MTAPDRHHWLSVTLYRLGHATIVGLFGLLHLWYWYCVDYPIRWVLAKAFLDPSILLGGAGSVVVGANDTPNSDNNSSDGGGGVRNGTTITCTAEKLFELQVKHNSNTPVEIETHRFDDLDEYAVVVSCVPGSTTPYLDMATHAVELFGVGLFRKFPLTSMYHRHVSTVLGAFRFPVDVLYDRVTVFPPPAEAAPSTFFFSRHSGHALKEEAIEFPQCTVCVDWCYCTSGDPLGVIVVVPGLASSSQSEYILTFVKHASTMFHVAVVNTRGMGDTVLDVPGLMSGAFTQDLRFILKAEFTSEVIAKKFHHHQHQQQSNSSSSTAAAAALPVFAVGFSLGANVLSKYLAEQGMSGEDPIIVAGAAVCTPWDFHETSRVMLQLEQLLIYQPTMTHGLLEYVKRHEHMFRRMDGIDHDLVLNSHPETARQKKSGDFDDGGRVKKKEESRTTTTASSPISSNRERTRSMRKTIQDFDKNVVVPHFGYDCVEDYYSDAMCFPRLRHVRVPLLCISAIDDPITGSPPLRRQWEGTAKENPNIVYKEFPAGGHLGFLMDPLSEFWCKANVMETTVVDSLAHFARRRTKLNCNKEEARAQ